MAAVVVARPAVTVSVAVRETPSYVAVIVTDVVVADTGGRDA